MVVVIERGGGEVDLMSTAKDLQCVFVIGRCCRGEGIRTGTQHHWQRFRSFGYVRRPLRQVRAATRLRTGGGHDTDTLAPGHQECVTPARCWLRVPAHTTISFSGGPAPAMLQPQPNTGDGCNANAHCDTHIRYICIVSCYAIKSVPSRLGRDTQTGKMDAFCSL